MHLKLQINNLVDLSTVAVTQNSNRSWVKIHSARWVNIQSAITAELAALHRRTRYQCHQGAGCEARRLAITFDVPRKFGSSQNKKPPTGDGFFIWRRRRDCSAFALPPRKLHPSLHSGLPSASCASGARWSNPCSFVHTPTQPNKKTAHKGRFFYLAEKAGFEPAVGYKPTHAFQACDLNHSSTSPKGRAG